MKEIKVPVLSYVRIMVQPKYDETEDVKVQVYDGGRLIARMDGELVHTVSDAVEEIKKRYHVFTFEEERKLLLQDGTDAIVRSEGD